MKSVYKIIINSSAKWDEKSQSSIYVLYLSLIHINKYDVLKTSEELSKACEVGSFFLKNKKKSCFYKVAYNKIINMQRAHWKTKGKIK